MSRVTPEAAEVLLGLAHALDWQAELDERRCEKTWWAERRTTTSAGGHDIAMSLGRFEVATTESEWCGECGTLQHKATYYRTVSSGLVSGIGRVLGRLAKQGLVTHDERYPSLWTLTAEGAALVDDAEQHALDHIREAVA